MSPAPEVVVPEFLPEPHLGRLGHRFRLLYDPDLYTDRPGLLAAMTEARGILVRNRTRIDAELLAASPRLEVVGRLGVGLDNIDTPACAEAGVVVVPAVGGNAVSVAEYVIGAMLVLCRGVFDMTVEMVAGRWPRQGHAFGNEVNGRTLGLIGYGSIARQVAGRAQALGMSIVAHDPYVDPADPAWKGVEPLDLPALLARSDVISVHLPLTEETRGLIDHDAIAGMKSGAVLINTARGGIVDEEALAGALRAGSLRGAALDVFAEEPLRPVAAERFRDLPNLILTPHIAGNTEEAVERIAEMIVDAVLAVLE